VLPPQERPHIPTLKQLGFTGREAEVLKRAQRDAPQLLAALSSASAMWTANAATVSPSADTADRRVHFTPANLATHLHRAIEPVTTGRALATIFRDDGHFAHHAPLPATPQLGDEGAANHTRLCAEHGQPGLELFTYGAAGEDEPKPAKYPARQTRAASEAILRLHEIDTANCRLVQQRPDAIDAGVFHNDVIAVGHRELLLLHEYAYLDTEGLRDWLRRRLRGRSPLLIEIAERELPLAEAVESYLFNSQIVSLPDGAMRLVCAYECRERERSWALLTRLVEDRGTPIQGVEVVDLRQSMRNGGGPACLRLRVVLTEDQRAAVNPKVWIDDKLAATLEAWVRKHYRDRLLPADLADPKLLDESRTALDQLTQILGLGSLYDFQR
jgi:succinylarginine dihydrolase